MTQALDHALQHAKNWLSSLDDRPVAALADIETLRHRLDRVLPETGLSPVDVIDELVTLTHEGHLGSAGGRFFAWVIGGSLESALAAEWLVSTWDQNAALSACGPSAAMVENVAGKWILDLLDLPRDASFALTTGCQMAHFTALAAARHAVLEQVGWNVEADGLFDAPRLRVLASRERHGSIERAARFLGLGQRAILPLETDDQGKVTPQGLELALVEAGGHAIVVLNAADLNIGAFDPFEELIPIAHAAGAWVHVDGAFGLFGRASRAKRHLLEGVELADSWATDGHKWLNVPFDCGLAIIQNRAAHKAAMTLTASYIAATDGVRDAIDWNPEWSRRARGFSIYAALRELGRQGVEDLVDRCCDHCRALVVGIGELSGACVVAMPSLNQGLVRFERLTGTPEENDTYTDSIIELINATGEAFFSGTTWKGRRAMRVSVVNWRTSKTDVERAIAAVTKVLSTRFE